MVKYRAVTGGDATDGWTYSDDFATFLDTPYTTSATADATEMQAPAVVEEPALPGADSGWWAVTEDTPAPLPLTAEE